MKNKQSLYVEQLKDGRFQYRLRYVDPRTGKAHRVSCIKETNSRQAYNQALRELQNRAVEAPYTRLKLGQVLTLYLEDKSRILRPQTVIRNESEIRQVNEALGDLYIDSLTVLDIKRAISSISEKNCTYNERLARYKAFLRWCYQNEILKDNLADKLSPLPDNKKQRIEDKYLEPEELQTLLDAIVPPMWYHLTLFLVLSGLRIGEAIALRMEDVGDKYISVTKTFSPTVKEMGDPKTGSSVREVFIQPELRAAIDDYLIYRDETGRRSPLFFPSRRNGPLLYGAYNKFLRELSVRVLGRVVTPHALRHTCASLMLANGVSVDTIARRLGHENSKVTREIYLHITEKLKAQDEESIQNFTILLPSEDMNHSEVAENRRFGENKKADNGMST